MGELTADCQYCGEKCSPRFMLCGRCWHRVCGEIQDRVTTTRQQFSTDSAEFENAVQGALKFLLWLDDEETS